MDGVNFTKAIGNNATTTLNNESKVILDNITDNLTLGPFPAGMPPSLAEDTLAYFIIHQIIIPMVTVLGILGNGSSLIILCKRKSNHAFLKYLTALTVADLLLLSAALLRSLALIVHRNIKPISFVKALSGLYLGIVAGACTQRLSATFTTIISFERFLAVVYPLHVRRSFVDRKPKSIIVATVAIQLLLQVPALITSRVGTLPIPGPVVYAVVPTWNTKFAEMVRNSYIILNLIIGNVAPLVIVLLTTIVIAVTLNKPSTLTKAMGGRNANNAIDSSGRVPKRRNRNDAIERGKMPGGGNASAKIECRRKPGEGSTNDIVEGERNLGEGRTSDTTERGRKPGRRSNSDTIKGEKNPGGGSTSNTIERGRNPGGRSTSDTIEGENNPGGGSTSNTIERERMTRVLIGIAVAFSICMFVTTAIFIMPAIGLLSSPSLAGIIPVMLEATHVFICLNSACNFACYLSASKQFRSLFLNQLRTTCTHASTTANSTEVSRQPARHGQK